MLNLEREERWIAYLLNAMENKGKYGDRKRLYRTLSDLTASINGLRVNEQEPKSALERIAARQTALKFFEHKKAFEKRVRKALRLSKKDMENLFSKFLTEKEGWNRGTIADIE